MKKPTRAEMSEDDWENLRKQLRTLVDIYCKQNDEILKIKDILKKIVKTMVMQQKKNDPKMKKEKSKILNTLSELPPIVKNYITSRWKKGVV